MKKYLKKNYGSVNQSDLYSRNRNDEEIHTLHTSHLQYLEDKDEAYIRYVLASHSTHNEHIDRQNGHKDEASWGNSTGERERGSELQVDGAERNSECTEEGDWRIDIHESNDLVGSN